MPQEILATPLGQTLAPLIASLDAPQPGSTAFSFEPQVGQRETSPGFDALNTEIEAARQHSQALDERRQAINEKLAKKERKKSGEKKKKRKSKAGSGNSSGESDHNSNSMSEAENSNGVNGGSAENVPPEMLPSEQALEDEAAERRAEEERKRARDPPIVFKEIDVSFTMP